MAGGETAVDGLREICLALPEATEKPFGGHTDPTWRVRDKIFAMYSDNHHGDGVVSVQCKAPRERRRCSSAPTRSDSLSRPTSDISAGSVYWTSGRSFGMSSQPSSMTATV